MVRVNKYRMTQSGVSSDPVRSLGTEGGVGDWELWVIRCSYLGVQGGVCSRLPILISFFLDCGVGQIRDFSMVSVHGLPACGRSGPVEHSNAGIVDFHFVARSVCGSKMAPVYPSTGQPKALCAEYVLS